MDTLPRGVERLVRIYGWMIKAYPAFFRRAYGDEMNWVFRDLAAEAWRRRGRFGLLALWFRVMLDLARSVPREHLAAIQRRIEMKAPIRVSLWVLLAAFVYYELMMAGLFVVIGVAYLYVDNGWLPLFENESCAAAVKIVMFYLPAFFMGMILARVKPFFRPSLTAPIGVMVPWGLMGLCCFIDEGLHRAHGSWYVWAGQVGMGILFVASLGLAAWLGCFVSNKLSGRLAKPQAA